MRKVEIATIDDVRAFARDVVGRAKHHAREVEETIVQLIGPAIVTSDPSTSIFGTKNDLDEWLNVVFLTINGKEHRFAFDHEADRITLRDQWTRKSVKRSFADADALTAGEVVDRLASV